MELRDVVNFGKSVVEAYLERALSVARTAERQYHKAAETYNFLADMLPIPLPRVGRSSDPYAPFEPPPAPPFAAPVATKGPSEVGTPPERPTQRPELKVVRTDDPPPPAKAVPSVVPAAPVVRDEPVDAAAAPASAAGARRFPRGLLRKMKKSDLQKIASDHGIAYDPADTNSVLVERILEATGEKHGE